jgi:hypothetical protein
MPMQVPMQDGTAERQRRLAAQRELALAASIAFERHPAYPLATPIGRTGEVVAGVTCNRERWQATAKSPSVADARLGRLQMAAIRDPAIPG